MRYTRSVMVAQAPDRLILQDVPRVGRVEQVIIGAMLACLAVFPLLAHGGFVALAVAFWSLTAVSAYRRHGAAVHLGIFFSLCFAAILLHAGTSQAWLGASLLIYALSVRMVPMLRSPDGWLRRGVADRVTIAIAAGFTVLAGLALVVWHQIVRPDLRDLLETFVPNAPLGVLLVGGVLFAMLTAAVEEAAYRGVLQQALGAAFGPAVALVGQALAFGALHIHGFPRGMLGIVLATIYGLMMGILRLRARGMLVPWVAHTATDVTIVTIVLFLAR